MLNKQFTVKQLLFSLIVAVMIFLGVFAGSCDNQATASQNNATAAGQKWGNSPNITNYYEYLQLRQIYESRDNPNLILNAYLQSLDGSLRCLGRVKGFGVPYGTQFSPPNSGSTAVPEPNALYPSGSTSADWVQLIDPKTGKVFITFVEPSLVITQVTLPCKPLDA